MLFTSLLCLHFLCILITHTISEEIPHTPLTINVSFFKLMSSPLCPPLTSCVSLFSRASTQSLHATPVFICCRLCVLLMRSGSLWMLSFLYSDPKVKVVLGSWTSSDMCVRCLKSHRTSESPFPYFPPGSSTTMTSSCSEGRPTALSFLPSPTNPPFLPFRPSFVWPSPERTPPREGSLPLSLYQYPPFLHRRSVTLCSILLLREIARPSRISYFP